MFTDDDLPMFRAKLRFPTEVGNMFEAFSMSSKSRAVTQHKLKGLHGFITYRSIPKTDEQRRMVEGYEWEWVESKR